MLTPRDTAIVEALTRRVRLFTLGQVGRTWWADAKHPEQAGGRRLAHLAEEGWVTLEHALAQPEHPLEEPLVEWVPGATVPEFGPIAHRLLHRWEEPCRSTPLVIATKRAARHFGGHGGKIPRRSELTHDVHVSAVYLRFRETHPHRANTWISEDDRKPLLEWGEKLPDAVVEEEGRPRAVELGGQYTAAKLEAFHDHCAARDLPYEIW